MSQPQKLIKFLKLSISFCSSSLILLTVIASVNIVPIDTIFPLSRNFFIFERANCRTYPGSKASAVQCRVKYIDRNHLKGYLSVNVTEPVGGCWLHGVGYYKYNTYQKIATEYWEDLCGWISGKHKSFVMDLYKPLIFKYSNFNHTCPYLGYYFGKSDNISAQEFAFPQIMPAGRYRMDVNVTYGGRRKLLFGGSVYFAISDHRVEIV